jgi:hypothetical protein
MPIAEDRAWLISRPRSGTSTRSRDVYPAYMLIRMSSAWRPTRSVVRVDGNVHAPGISTFW